MRGAGGTVILGLALVVLAGLFDSEPLYVPGAVLLLLGGGSAAWVRASARGVRITREIGAARVIEGETLLVELHMRAAGIAPPAGFVDDPLLTEPAPLLPGRRHTTVRVRARFARRGMRRLLPPRVVVTDPLGLAERAAGGDGPVEEILVLPRVEPVVLGAAAGDAATGIRGRPGAAAEVDLDGVRPHRPGTPASRISWPVFARTGELHDRVLRADADARPLLVLDLRGTADEQDADAAVRAAASLCVHLGDRGGCALLLPGERRPLLIEPGLRGWPTAHARLAIADGTHAPALGALGVRRGAIIWVAARAVREAPRALTRMTGGPSSRMLVVPGQIPGRRAAFTVAGCSGYVLGRTRAPEAPAPTAAAEGSAA